ncbi:T9SS type A sorting domain-containing protein [Hymenobacter antarcticus]|uniref:Secretion system C-terminal sorting domain-containing protein n=1 Tax=Hymenobacter antarcticus TaxID=486270 RepID=A0ABP7PHT9_9BACT
MKRNVLRFPLLLAAGLLTLSTTHAQQAVPNGAMETWLTRNGGEAPAQWLTTDDALQVGLPGFPVTNAVSKSTDKRGGSFAARLVNTNTLAGPVPGFMALGTNLNTLLTADSLVELGGLPYTTRAARMQFYYKFSGTIADPDDRPVARVQLTKTTGGVRRVVASGQRYLTAAATYTLTDFPLVYRLGIAPDSVHIAFGSGDFDGGNFTAGNTLLVDDIALTGTVTATRDAQLQAAVSAYPNPSATGLFTLSTSETGLLAAPFSVTDALGRVVLRQAAEQASAAPVRTVDLRSQSAGVYCLRLDSPRGPVVKQLVIR